MKYVGQKHKFRSFRRLLFRTFFAVMNGQRVTLELQTESCCPLILSDLNQNGCGWTAFGTVVQYESPLSDFMIARLEVLPAVLMRFKSSEMYRHADSK
jgi:hypothetical protein